MLKVIGLSGYSIERNRSGLQADAAVKKISNYINVKLAVDKRKSLPT
jgi:hypothetical protein